MGGESVASGPRRSKPQCVSGEWVVSQWLKLGCIVRRVLRNSEMWLVEGLKRVSKGLVGGY